MFSGVFVCLFTAWVSAKQVMKFDIILFNEKIGELTVTRDLKPDGSELFVLSSSSRAKILWIDRENDSYYEYLYKNGRLLSSSYKEKERGKLVRWGTTKIVGNNYVSENYSGKTVLKEVPVYTVPSIYFHDFTKMQRMYYDAEAEFVPVEHPDSQTITYKTSDGHRNVYHYVNGQLHHLEVHVSFASVKMVRVE